MSPPRHPKVSAVLQVYNRTAFLAEALRSICAQDYEGEIETIVVDDGSDVPVEPLFAAEFPDVRWVRQANQGLGASRQAGCDRAEGDFIAFLDDDDAWHPTKTRLQVELLRARPELAGVGSDLTAIEGLSVAGEALLRARGLVAAASIETVAGVPDAYVLSPERLLEFVFRHFAIFPSSLLVPRASLERIGGWSRTIRGMGECHDFLARLTHGHPLGYVDRPLLILRRGHGDHMTRNTDWAQFEEAKVLCRRLGEYPESLRAAVRKPMADYLERIAFNLRTHRHMDEAAQTLQRLMEVDGVTWKRLTKLAVCRIRRRRASAPLRERAP